MIAGSKPWDCYVQLICSLCPRKTLQEIWWCTNLYLSINHHSLLLDPHMWRVPLMLPSPLYPMSIPWNNLVYSFCCNLDIVPLGSLFCCLLHQMSFTVSMISLSPKVPKWHIDSLVGATFVQPAIVDYQGQKSMMFVFAVSFEPIAFPWVRLTFLPMHRTLQWKSRVILSFDTRFLTSFQSHVITPVWPFRLNAMEGVSKYIQQKSSQVFKHRWSWQRWALRSLLTETTWLIDVLSVATGLLGCPP